jgi:hypothetical protein
MTRAQAWSNKSYGIHCSGNAISTKHDRDQASVEESDQHDHTYYRSQAIRR